LRGEYSTVDDMEIRLPERTLLLKVWGYPIFDEHSEVQFAVSAFNDITEDKRNRDNMEYALREKEVLLREVHHRVKNNMAIVSSLLNMQSGYVDDEKHLQMFRESQGRIRSMALVHEQLYQSDDFAHIKVQDYIRSLSESINNTFGAGHGVHMVLDVDEIELDIETLIPCGLIINELMTNSFKHAFNGQDSPELHITLKKQDRDKASLSIADNGTGLPEGFDISLSGGLGFKLIEALISQIDGSLKIKSGDGMSAQITFPVEMKT